MMENDSRIAVAGAGSIGCYVGGRLAAAGRTVRFLVRPQAEATLRLGGLKLIDLDGRESLLDPADLKLTVDPAIAFAGVDIILVTVKSGATEAMAKLIARHAPPEAIVISLQNGVDNAEVLRRNLPAQTTIISGMVPFNVIQSEPDQAPLTVRRTTAGTIFIGDKSRDLADFLSVPRLAVAAKPDIQAILWGKLLMNLNNAPNALSNLPLVEQLADRDWRLLLANQISEGLKVLRAHGIAVAKVQGAPPAVLPWILRLPNFLFRIVAGKMLAINPHARSSMWEDLSRGRPTEIDYLQGAIIRLADQKRIEATTTRKVLACVKRAEGQPLRSHSVQQIRAVNM
ncbi:2-dehydropantoate 2-reductase [Phyllobacterium endophyticum]|uniref:2-dehydropantoate 2-reductase n=1 Tax=Phyllobacterium endophyticum TaxID=1149773 RepID=UPI0011C9C895|nr:2-dehydropantoate 2-reductase [Phyllobacterium endophyticum]TXR50051.1 2-dehydropantoate 2-reductase [Phyllobacterium endophyticum]